MFRGDGDGCSKHREAIITNLIGKDHWLTRRLEQQPDIEHVGIELVLKPVSHFVRSLVIFDSVREGGFHGAWVIKHLWAFGVEPQLDGSIGYKTPSMRGATVVVIERLPPAVSHASFQRLLEEDTLPFLRSIDSMERLHRLFLERLVPERLDPVHHFRLELAMGNFEVARDLLSQRRDEWLHSPVDYFDEDEAERTRLLCALLDDGDFVAIAQVFHTWEATLVERMELSEFWQPSPFPFEPGYAEWLRSQADGRQ